MNVDLLNEPRRSFFLAAHLLHVDISAVSLHDWVPILPRIANGRVLTMGHQGISDQPTNNAVLPPSRNITQSAGCIPLSHLLYSFIKYEQKSLKIQTETSSTKFPE